MTQQNTLSSKALRVILQEHYLWLISGGKDGKRADLSGHVLSGMNLVAANLEKAVLEGTVLEAADMRRANLREANLQGAGLQRANLRGADLRDANLRGAYLRDTNLQGAYLRDTNLQGAYLREANFQGAYLRDTNLKSAYLREANLQGAHLWRTDLRGADIQTVRFQSALMDNVIGVPFRDTPENIKRIIDGFDQQIKALQERVRDAESVFSVTGASEAERQEEIRELQDKISLLNEAKKQREEGLALKQEEAAELQRQMKRLEQRTRRAQKALLESLHNVESRMKSGSRFAFFSGLAGTGVLAADVAIILSPLWSAWSQGMTADAVMYLMFNRLETWSVVFYVIPAVVLVLVSAVLFYQQRKLLAEVRYYAVVKHQIEVFAGLLEAAQHTAAGWDDPHRASEYVHETFTRIRDNLLHDLGESFPVPDVSVLDDKPEGGSPEETENKESADWV
nr:pentapeptide repeat-containing protein [Conchiformibius kuhniae]